MLFTLSAAAVEVQASVAFVVDGDTIAVTIEGVEKRVRLLFVDTAESKDNAHGIAMDEGKAAKEFLTARLNKGLSVVLWGPGQRLEQDRYERLLAVIYRDGIEKASEQESLIAAGWSVYWRKYGSSVEPLNTKLIAAMESAKAAKVGAWGTATKWMNDKANERTAPRK